MFRIDKPLWMPPGSVRGILALGIVGAYIFGQIDEQIVGLVLGAYFVDRASKSSV